MQSFSVPGDARSPYRPPCAEKGVNRQLFPSLFSYPPPPCQERPWSQRGLAGRRAEVERGMASCPPSPPMVTPASSKPLRIGPVSAQGNSYASVRPIFVSCTPTQKLLWQTIRFFIDSETGRQGGGNYPPPKKNTS